VRHGAISLLAILEAQTGKFRSRCVACHTSEEFARFLDVAKVGQRRKQIHMILDDLSAHKKVLVRACLDRTTSRFYHRGPGGAGTSLCVFPIGKPSCIPQTANFAVLNDCGFRNQIQQSVVKVELQGHTP